MRSIWIFCVIVKLIACTYAGPIEVIYSGDGCDCPTKLGYQVNIPQYPAPPKYKLNHYGYKIDVPPVPAKAKLSYTFDFSVEEPKPPCPKLAEKLNLMAKIDRIALNKPDCKCSYARRAAAPACSCSQSALASPPLYRYVSRRIAQPCKCQQPKCKCNSRIPNSIIRIQTPILVASGPLERRKRSVRRKRDLERIFFRPRRQDLERSARYIKLYNKPLPTTSSTENDKEDWLNMDFFTDANPFKRKTKKVLFPSFGSRIVKRDIKGEYDLLEKERQKMDLTLAEIIQFMPETLQPNFKRDRCQFGCSKNKLHQLPNEVEDMNRDQEKLFDEENKKTEIEIDTTTTTTTTTSPSHSSSETDERKDNTFTKRNAKCCPYSGDVSPNSYPYVVASSPYGIQSPMNPLRDPSSLSLCDQRQLYATMRNAAEQPQPQPQQKFYGNSDQLQLPYAPSRVVPDPFGTDAMPLYYSGELEIPEYSFNPRRLQDAILSSPQYPVQHVSKEDLDGIISDIVYKHPDFIEASSHYGGALVDPAPEQIQQTKDFVEKLIKGRFGLFFDEPFDPLAKYYRVPSYPTGPIYNPYVHPRSSFSQNPAIY